MQKVKKILLVRPPRYLWPFLAEGNISFLPLGLLSIGTVIKHEFPHFKLKIIDCPTCKIGWKTLEKIIREEQPDMVGASDETLHHHETLRLFKLSKEINEQVINVAGGHFFSWVTETLKQYPLDIIVRFEAEETIKQLLHSLEEGKDLSTVKGIAFTKNKQIIETSFPPLIQDLDSLPFPEYDLLIKEESFPRDTKWIPTLEHGRGCRDCCSFCSLWTFWGNKKEVDVPRGKLNIKPNYRTKSVERTIEEVDIIYNKHGGRYLFWVDPTFNIEPQWTDHFCSELLRRNYRDLFWWAYLRADFILRDEGLGIFSKMVQAGLKHPLIGIERECTTDYKKVQKSHYNTETVKKVFSLLKEKYPQIFRQGTFVCCLPFDTQESILNLIEYAKELDLDYPAFHPVAPVPGTCLYQEMLKKDLIAEKDFAQYDWDTPVLHSLTGLSREDFVAINRKLHRRYIRYRLPKLLKELIFSQKAQKKGPYWGFFQQERSLYWWFCKKGIKIIASKIGDIFLKRKPYDTGFKRLRKPGWYED